MIANDIFSVSAEERDPTWRLTRFEKTIREIKEMCKKYDSTPDQEQGDTPGVEEEIEDENLSGVERLKKRRRISADTAVPLPVSSQIDIKIDKYLNMPQEDCMIGLDWWKENKGSFSILRKLAAEILSIPASSASSDPPTAGPSDLRVGAWLPGRGWYPAAFGSQSG